MRLNRPMAKINTRREKKEYETQKLTTVIRTMHAKYSIHVYTHIPTVNVMHIAYTTVHNKL